MVGGGFFGWMLDVGEDGWMVLELGGGGWKLGRDECRWVEMSGDGWRLVEMGRTFGNELGWVEAVVQPF